MERGMNERIRSLRKASADAQPRLSLERALLETVAYRLYEGRVSVPELRALTFKHIMEHKEIHINDGELIVGEKGENPQTAPTFPELCCHTLDDMRVMDGRELISFKVSDGDFKKQEEIIIPFWEKRCIRAKIMEAMTPEWKDCYASGIFTEFMEQRGPGHTVGSEIIYKNGFLDFKDKISESIKSLDFAKDPDALSKKEQLNAMSICCDGIIALGRRYEELARAMAGEESDPLRRIELERIAENCSVVPANKPQTFWQALQMYWFVHLGVTTELNPWDAYSPGRLDQHLYPFYKKDTDCGIMDEYHAKELLECRWVKFNNQPAPPKVGITLKESGTYTDFANINTGGVALDGSDGVNPVSYLILDCMEEMRLLQPSSNVQISKKNPRAFLRRACEISREGWGQPAFYNTEAIIQELLNAGKTIDDARRGGSSGCVETGAFGSEAYILTGYFNLPKILELTLNDGYDSVSGRQLGLRLGRGTDFKDYAALMEAFKCQIQHFVDIKITGSNTIEAIYAKYMPEVFLSVITNDCIARGKDYNAGGARYNTSYLQGVGIGTVTDSLAAIKHHVYEKKDITMERLLKGLESDFDGDEALRQTLLNKSPKYGNDDDYADDIMREVFKYYDDCVTGRPNMRGGSYRVNMLPTTCHVYFGEVMTASANGRRAGKPVSEGISPTQGADTNGPTAVLRSASKMDHLRTGGTLLNQKFSPGAVEGPAGLDGMADLIRAYFAMDGHHIQFNVIGRETLIKAQQNPEEYKDLIVRVAGYSDHFRNLGKALQDEIIERTEQAL
ncbi:MAG: glycyl radical protein [Clostridiales bacterium]|jgi:formate C-acetyltransferase|nr:glycyl radical protein [Clostridiales bacterium]